MTHSEIERDYLAWRALTGAVAVGVGAFGKFLGEGMSDGHKKEASDIAAETINIASIADLDPPSWAQRGVRIKIGPNDQS
jgi:hypothetical protein